MKIANNSLRRCDKALATADDKRSFSQRLDLFAAGPKAGHEDYVSLVKTYKELNATLAAVPTTMVLRERTAPRKTHILVKGDFTRPADEVSPGTPSVLHPFDNSKLGRIDSIWHVGWWTPAIR